MTQIEVISKQRPNESSPRVLRKIRNVNLAAETIINANNLLVSLDLLDLMIPAQKRQKEAVRGFIAWNVLNDKINTIVKGPRAVRFARRFVIGMGWYSEEQLLRDSLQLIEEQNDHYLRDKENYPRAENIKSIVGELFWMVKERTGKPISPDVDIDPIILREWKSRIS